MVLGWEIRTSPPPYPSAMIGTGVAVNFATEHFHPVRSLDILLPTLTKYYPKHNTVHKEQRIFFTILLGEKFLFSKTDNFQPTPVTIPINGFGPGHRIRIVGIPAPNAHRFWVNLNTPSDTAFHFNPRFDVSEFSLIKTE